MTGGLRIVCRHGWTLEQSCEQCLGVDDWHVERDRPTLHVVARARRRMRGYGRLTVLALVCAMTVGYVVTMARNTVPRGQQATEWARFNAECRDPKFSRWVKDCRP